MAQEHKNALVFLTDLASQVGDDAKDLKVAKVFFFFFFFFFFRTFKNAIEKWFNQLQIQLVDCFFFHMELAHGSH